MKIYEIAKCLSGNVLGIGVDEKITEILNNNNRIKNCNLLNSYSKTIKKDKQKRRQKARSARNQS